MNMNRLRRISAVCGLAISMGITGVVAVSAMQETDETSVPVAVTMTTETPVTTTTILVTEPVMATALSTTTINSATSTSTAITSTTTTKSTTNTTTSTLTTTAPTTISTTSTTTATEVTTSSSVVYNAGVSLTDNEKQLLATLVYLEADTNMYECQKAIASLVINRMLTKGSSLTSIVYEPNQFSVASRLSSTNPSDLAVTAVDDVLTNGTTLPIYVTYFRAGYYHSWGDQVPYCNIGNTYFSYSQALKNQYT